MKVRVNVQLVLRDPDGTIVQEFHGENLITDVGDGFIAARLHDDDQAMVSGFRYGTGVIPVSKNGSGAALELYVPDSSVALLSVESESLGPDLGWQVAYETNWPAGVASDPAVTEFVITDEDPISNVAGNEADTVGRFTSPPFDKRPDRDLSGTWTLTFLGDTP